MAAEEGAARRINALAKWQRSILSTHFPFRPPGCASDLRGDGGEYASGCDWLGSVLTVESHKIGSLRELSIQQEVENGSDC